MPSTEHVHNGYEKVFGYRKIGNKFGVDVSTVGTDETLFRLASAPGEGALVLPLQLESVALVCARVPAKGYVQTGARDPVLGTGPLQLPFVRCIQAFILCLVPSVFVVFIVLLCRQHTKHHSGLTYQVEQPRKLSEIFCFAPCLMSVFLSLHSFHMQKCTFQ